MTVLTDRDIERMADVFLEKIEWKLNWLVRKQLKEIAFQLELFADDIAFDFNKSPMKEEKDNGRSSEFGGSDSREAKGASVVG